METEAIKCKMSLEEKRKLLDSAKGQYFSVCWVKKSGETREAIAKKWERRFLHGEPGQNKNTCADKPHLYTIAEQAVEGYRNVDLRRLRKVKINRVVYDFED